MSSVIPFAQALWVVLLPLAVAIVPGLPLGLKATGTLYDKMAYTLLWSIALTIATLSLAATAGLSGIWVAGALAAGALGVVGWQHYHLPTPAWQLLLLGVVFVVIFLLLASPFLIHQYGLPTGDSQKAVYWATFIADTASFPDYEQSIQQLNRDPVDFFTPGLHAVIALFIRSSTVPLSTVGLWAIILTIATAAIAAATIATLFPKLPTLVAPAVVVVLLLTNFRFLRYVREPGYHLQNILGELLLFGLLYVCVRLYEHISVRDVVLAVLLFSTLVISHQFSAFLAVFALLPLLCLLVIVTTRRHMPNSARRKIQLLAVVVGIVLTGLLTLWQLNLFEKIPHLFTSTPHLRHLVPMASEYASLLGAPWFFLGIGGYAYLIILAFRQRLSAAQQGWLGSSLVLLVLSQGPRLGIDIPPVRALFYSIVPLAISGTLLLIRAWQSSSRVPLQYLVHALAALLLLTAATSSVIAAFTPALHLRTNSTYSPGQAVLVEYLAAERATSGVLVDDYNRRSASWLILGKHPMYTRLAADISQQMAESKQSSLRNTLYLNQLDYEKIFSLGSLPDIAPLLARHHVAWVTGIDNSSASSFRHNPLLTVFASADDITLFTPRSVTGNLTPTSVVPASLHTWLLKPTTLANDIGDDEDTFEHLPASLRTPRLSKAHVKGNSTWRDTTSPIIPMRFNVGDFVKVLWSKEGQQQPDTALEFVGILAEPAAGLILRTTNGTELPFTSGTPLRLEAAQVAYEEDEFVSLYLLNPQQQVISLDVIALGLARVP